MPDEVTLIFHSPIFLLHVSWEESFTIKLSWKIHKSILVGNVYTNTNFIHQEDDDNDDVWWVWCFYTQVLSGFWELNDYYKFLQSQQSGATLLSCSASKYYQNKQINKHILHLGFPLYFPWLNYLVIYTCLYRFLFPLLWYIQKNEIEFERLEENLNENEQWSGSLNEQGTRVLISLKSVFTESSINQPCSGSAVLQPDANLCASLISRNALTYGTQYASLSTHASIHDWKGVLSLLKWWHHLLVCFQCLKSHLNFHSLDFCWNNKNYVFFLFWG